MVPTGRTWSVCEPPSGVPREYPMLVNQRSRGPPRPPSRAAYRLGSNLPNFLQHRSNNTKSGRFRSDLCRHRPKLVQDGIVAEPIQEPTNQSVMHHAPAPLVVQSCAFEVAGRLRSVCECHRAKRAAPHDRTSTFSHSAAIVDTVADLGSGYSWRTSSILSPYQRVGSHRAGSAVDRLRTPEPKLERRFRSSRAASIQRHATHVFVVTVCVYCLGRGTSRKHTTQLSRKVGAENALKWQRELRLVPPHRPDRTQGLRHRLTLLFLYF